MKKCGKVSRMKRSSRIALFTLFVFLAFSFSGCAARPIHPGAANQFDSSSYDTLLVAHSVIESTKAELAANKFSANIASSVTVALNRLVQAYNLADEGYIAYHKAAVAGTATPVDQSALQSKLNDVSNAVTAVTSAKGGM